MGLFSVGRRAQLAPARAQIGSSHFLHCRCLAEKCDLDCVFRALMESGGGGDSTRMTIARSEGEEKSRSAFTHIGERDSSDGPLSVVLLSRVEVEL